MASTILSYIPTVLGFLIAIVTLLYVYFKFVIFKYWKNRDVFYEEPVFPLGVLGPVIAGKINPG